MCCADQQGVKGGLHVPECSVSGAAGASVPWVLVSAVEVAKACAAQVREPAPDQGLSPAGSPPRGSARVTSPPHGRRCWLLWGREGGANRRPV